MNLPTKFPPIVLRTLLILGSIAASALFLVLAMPLGEQSYLAWFAFVPLLKITRSTSFLAGVVAALLTTFLAAGLSITGLFYAHKDPAGSPVWVYTGFFIFGLAMSIGMGAWSDKASKGLPLWWFAGLAVLLEAFLLFQIPVHLALTEYRSFLMLQISAVGGIWLVSFLIWWSNFYLSTLTLRKLVFASIVIVFLSAISQWVRPQIDGPSGRYAVVQISEPDSDRLRRMQTLASKGDPSFVVWPEFAGIPYVLGGDTKRLQALSAEDGVRPIVTSFPDSHIPLPHNAGALFSSGTISAAYWKRKLFGGEVKMHTPGETAVAVPFDKGNVGLNICFDSCYPEIIRDTARLPGVNVIAVPSIDPYGSNNFLAAIHAAYTPFRAAEEGVSIIKCDGLAYSIFVNPYGQIIRELPPGDQVASAALPTSTHWTPYRTFGDWFLWLIGIVVLVRFSLHWKGLRGQSASQKREE